MTEAEWRACDDPERMVPLLSLRGECRKWRLFAVECCRAALRDIPSRKLESVLASTARCIEGRADGLEEHAKARFTLAEVQESPRTTVYWLTEAVGQVYAGHNGGWGGGQRVLGLVLRACRETHGRKGGRKNKGALAGLVREIFGDHIYPLGLHPRWLTSTVAELAEVIYEENAFDRLPILADALQDAGCEDADILDHCRRPGSHVRGCWVVDLVLGKE